MKPSPLLQRFLDCHHYHTGEPESDKPWWDCPEASFDPDDEDEDTLTKPTLSVGPIHPVNDPVVQGAKADLSRAETFLQSAQQTGQKTLESITRQAVSRLLQSNDPMAAKQLFTGEELEELAKALSATNATAELMGRARVRLRMQMAQDLAAQGVRRFAELPAPLEKFAEPWQPIPPLRALEHFRNLIPRINVSPNEWATGQAKDAFSLARVTDATLLARIQQVIGNHLMYGTAPSAPAEIESVLTQAGVTPRNPQYSELVWRTNAMSALNRGAMLEMQAPDVAEFFPVWRYAAIVDVRSRPEHAERNGRYYLNAKDFEDVRGREAKDACNCRCVPVPISAYEWEDLQRAGAQTWDE